MERLSIIGIVIGVVVLLLLIGLFLNLSVKSSNSTGSCGINTCKVGGAEVSKVILFYANWCGYCQQVKPIWRKLENEFPGYVTSIDGDLRPSVKDAFDVNGFPTIIYAPNGIDDPSGAVVYEGARDEESFRQFINGNR